LSVTDNAGNAVFLHVSASSERQECGNKSELKKGTKRDILKHHDVYVSVCLVVLFHVVLFHTVSGHIYTFTSYYLSEYHIKTTNKTPPQIILYTRHTKRHTLEKWKFQD